MSDVEAETPASDGGNATDEDVDDEGFDPIGTVVLIAIYMSIVVAMWIFTYFVEFLGRGLTVLG